MRAYEANLTWLVRLAVPLRMSPDQMDALPAEHLSRLGVQLPGIPSDDGGDPNLTEWVAMANDAASAPAAAADAASLAAQLDLDSTPSTGSRVLASEGSGTGAQR